MSKIYAYAMVNSGKKRESLERVFPCVKVPHWAGRLVSCELIEGNFVALWRLRSYSDKWTHEPYRELKSRYCITISDGYTTETLEGTIGKWQGEVSSELGEIVNEWGKTVVKDFKNHPSY